MTNLIRRYSTEDGWQTVEGDGSGALPSWWTVTDDPNVAQIAGVLSLTPVSTADARYGPGAVAVANPPMRTYPGTGTHESVTPLLVYSDDNYQETFGGKADVWFEVSDQPGASGERASTMVATYRRSGTDGRTIAYASVDSAATFSVQASSEFESGSYTTNDPVWTKFASLGYTGLQFYGFTQDGDGISVWSDWDGLDKVFFLGLSSAATKFGVFDKAAAPSAQRTHIADPTGGATVDSQSRTAIAAIIDALEAYGWLAAT